MALLFQGIFFFLVFALIQYLFKTKNILGSGENYDTKKEALQSAILTSLVASLIYVGLLYYFG